MLISPRFHRWHHSVGWGHEGSRAKDDPVGRPMPLGGHNFGVLFPWWDDLLGGPIAVKDGFAVPGEAPGVGAEVAASWFPRAAWHTVIKS